MEYICKNCYRTFVYNQDVAFCPFCGHAYNLITTPQQINQVVTRVIIGSDSEKTIQEKYWKESQNTIRRIISMLFYQLPDLFDVNSGMGEISIDIPSSMQYFCAGNTISGFKELFSNYLDRLVDGFDTKNCPTSQIQQKTETKYQLINIKQEEQTIKQICSDIIDLIGGSLPTQIIPQVEVVVCPKEEKKEYNVRNKGNNEKNRELIKAVISNRQQILAIIEGYSTYIIKEINSIDEEDMELLDPDELALKLRSLSEKDYDYLFGDDPREYIQTYWDAVVYLAYVSNDIRRKSDVGRAYEENERIEAQEGKKIEVLRQYISEWNSVITVQLDEVYQRQDDMVSIYKKLGVLEERLQKQLEEHKEGGNQ